MRSHLTNLQTIYSGEDVEKREPSCTAGGKVKWYSHHGEEHGDSLKLWNYYVTQQSHYWACTLKKTQFKKTHAPPMFTAALLTRARTRKQPRCPLTGKWTKLWYISTMECYWAMTRNNCESAELRWMNLKPVIQSEVKTEREKQILYINRYIWNLEKWYWWTYSQGRNRDTDIENRRVDTAREGEGEMNWEKGTEALTYMHYHTRNRQLVGSCCVTQGAQPTAPWWPSGVGRGQR